MFFLQDSTQQLTKVLVYITTYNCNYWVYNDHRSVVKEKCICVNNKTADCVRH